MITIVFCHPLTKSFNHDILNAVTRKLSDSGEEYDVINLYGENFNPVLDSTELCLHEKGQTDDPLARQYIDALRKTTKLIFIFPIWWGSMPAMLKGFIEKTFLKGVVYDTTPEGAMLPCLSIDNTIIVTTSEEDSEIFGNYIMGYFTPLTLSTVGINGVQWFNFDHISHRSDAERQTFLTGILSHV